MSLGQYKRIYNLVFGLLVICSCVFVYRLSKDFVSDQISDIKERQWRVLDSFRYRPSYDDLIKQGKKQEAAEESREAGHYNAVERRIRFCEDNLGMLSLMLMLLAYATVYFLVWFSGCLCVRYIKNGATKTTESK
jgi:hypothetical protein